MFLKKLLPIIVLILHFPIIVSSGVQQEPSILRVPKVVVITGAAQGIGFTSAEYLAQQGYCVCAGIRKTSSRTQLDALAQKFPDRVMIVELDVTDQAMIDAGCKAILKCFGRIDVLVNNACEVLVGTMESQTIEEQKRVIDVNYFGPARMIQAIAPIMRQQESGNIINISSIAGIEPFPHLESYVASKYALEGLSESLATTLAAWNINISIIEPAAIRTQGPAHMQLGTRINQDTQCFEKFNQFTLAWMRKRLHVAAGTPHYTEPIEIAKCIETIITTEKPHLRYQIGDVAKNIASTRFKDVTGDSYVKAKKKQFAERGFVVRQDKNLDPLQIN